MNVEYPTSKFKVGYSTFIISLPLRSRFFLNFIHNYQAVVKLGTYGPWTMDYRL